MMYWHSSASSLPSGPVGLPNGAPAPPAEGIFGFAPYLRWQGGLLDETFELTLRRAGKHHDRAFAKTAKLSWAKLG